MRIIPRARNGDMCVQSFTKYAKEQDLLVQGQPYIFSKNLSQKYKMKKYKKRIW